MTLERHRLSQLWKSLWPRTTDPDDRLYRANGAIGVRVCREWRDFEAFHRWATRTGSKPNLCLARIWGRGPSCRANCVASPVPQEARDHL